MKDNDDGLAVEMAPLRNGDPEGEKHGILKPKKGVSDMNPNVAQHSCNSLWALATAYVSYVWEYAPWMCWTLSIFALLIPTYLIITDVFFNKTEHFGEIKNDYSNINSLSNFDLKMKDIGHWCLKGDNDSCRCEDPTIPQPRNEFRSWSNAHAGNVQLITDMIEQGMDSPEIAFVGGSVVEKMDGRWFGDVSLTGLNDVANIFDKHFSGKNGSMTAAALGIAADQNQSVLWRILNGEMPNEFNPKIWWLELGLNDLGRAQCSEEVVVIGVLRIVEEIMKAKPDAKIVINSLFPMAELRGGLLPPSSVDLERSFGGNRPKGGWKEDRKKDRPWANIDRSGPAEGRPSAAHKVGWANKDKDRSGPDSGRPKPNAAQNGGQNNNNKPPPVLNYRPRTFNKNAFNKKDGGSNPSNIGERPSAVNSGNRRNLREAKDRGGFRDRDRSGGGGGGGGVPEGFRNRDRDGGGGFRKRDDIVKLISDRKSQHEFNPVTHRENRMPLWTSITAINMELRKFCNNNENVSFFDVTKIFTEKDGKHYNLKTNMISRRGLPTNAGFEAWENAVAIRAKQLLL
jgi:hypothetical protein